LRQSENLPAVGLSTCTIDEFSFPLQRPSSVEELGEAVRRADAKGQALYPVGGGTRLDLGLPPARPGVAIDLTALDRVIDYPARDMTITVQAGITLDRLQTALAAEGQRLPIDVPSPDRATLGGAMATNASGPRRLGAGTLRDYVIGITTINDAGHETKAGGRVVKNVAGYDLCKLHVGALGTLGIISQVTLKVRPLPQATALVTAGCEGPALAGLLDQLHASRARPMCLDLLNARAAARVQRRAGARLPARPWLLVVGFEDSEEAVNWQLGQAIKELTAAGAPGVEALAGASAAPLWQALTELTAPAEARLTLQAGVLPSALAAWCLAADDAPGELLVTARAGSGIARAHLTADASLEEARALVRRLAAESPGHVTLPRCPAAWKRELPVWGRPRDDAWLMRQVKDQLDPRRLFNPGRFVDGL
jgi:glycolate oxidase FAD binding subunit